MINSMVLGETMYYHTGHYGSDLDEELQEASVAYFSKKVKEGYQLTQRRDGRQFVYIIRRPRPAVRK